MIEKEQEVNELLWKYQDDRKEKESEQETGIVPDHKEKKKHVRNRT